MGPTLVLYLLGTREAAPRGWDETRAGMATAPAMEARLAAAAAARAVEVGLAAAAMVTVVAVTEHGLELPAGEGEEWHTLGRKVCPPRAFTMVGLEKERRWRGELQTGNENMN